jgi:hypothetical protein
MVFAIVAFLLTLLAREGTLAIVVAAAVVLDGPVSANLVFGQRAIYALAADLRSRMNALYIATFFTAGALVSVAAARSFVHFGWPGSALPLATLSVQFH